LPIIVPAFAQFPVFVSRRGLFHRCESALSQGSAIVYALRQRLGTILEELGPGDGESRPARARPDQTWAGDQ
jgi:hypothetical protein